MERQPELTEAEWQLVLELLECERRDLVSAIHHAGSSADREELRARHELVHQLVRKINAARGGAEVVLGED
ncbi:MAG: hypothetical protein KatS3mg102_0213 [Planctomycetota bacterium]|nr:MAG: hypothetical protein KatS3mg102_0213 [Planctomycetota bacterium]